MDALTFFASLSTRYQTAKGVISESLKLPKQRKNLSITDGQANQIIEKCRFLKITGFNSCETQEVRCFISYQFSRWYKHSK